LFEVLGTLRRRCAALRRAGSRPAAEPARRVLAGRPGRRGRGRRPHPRHLPSRVVTPLRLRGPRHIAPASRLHFPPVGGLTMPPTRQTSRTRPAKTPQPAGADSQPADLTELVTEAQDGGREALERLLAAARPKLHALAMRVLGDADEAEDAVQDAMIKVWR